MGKTFSKKSDYPKSKKENKQNTKSKKHHEKGKYPHRIWPTDSEKDGHKGPKI